MAAGSNQKSSAIVCRAAKLTDYDDVMAIGDVFFGIDYLQHYYTKYIKDPNYFCFVCEVDGKVVGEMNNRQLSLYQQAHPQYIINRQLS